MEKVKEDEFNRVCRSAQLLEIKIGAKVPTWSTPDRTQGIELKAGKIVTFRFIDGMRKSEPAVDDSRICSVVGAFETKAPEPKEEKKTNQDVMSERKNEQPKSENKEVQTKEIINNTPLLPDFLTPALMSKWAKLSTTDRILMFQQTPKDQIYQVNVGKNPDTGKAEMAAYVKGNYMFKEANAAFLFDWYLSEIIITVCPTGVGVTAKLNGYFSEYGRYLSRPAIGYQELNKKVDSELAKKGATTDAIKKGLSLFGFNSDVYSGEV